MSFLKGSLTCQRFNVEGGLLSKPDADLSEVVSSLAKRSFQNPVSLDGSEYPKYGWCGGRDIADTLFTDEHLLRGPFVCFGLLVIREVIPQSDIAARARQELEAMALDRPIRPQDRRAAATAAKEQLQEEGRKTGQYLVRKVIPVVYDSEKRQLWLHSTSHTVAAGFQALVEVTLGSVATPIDVRSYIDADSVPTGETPEWLGEDEGANAWGNLFAAEVVKRGADQDVPLDTSFDWPSGDRMVKIVPRRTVTVRCPAGVKGLDRFDHELPYSVPEAGEAVRAGKLPTVLGMDLIYNGHDVPVPLSLVPHRLTVSGARLPKGEAKDRAEADMDRLTAIREMLDAVDGAVVSYAQKHLK